MGIVVVEGLEDDRDQGPNVLDISGLGVEAGNGGDLECVLDVKEEGHLWWCRELPLGGGEVVLETVRGSLLLLPHKGGLVLTFTGGGDNGLGGGVGRSHSGRVSDDGGSSQAGAQVGNQRRGGVREEAMEGGVAMVKVRVCCH
jgi:hypothetical protein